MSPTGGKRNNDEAEGAGDNSDIHNISDELVIDVKMEEEYESDDQNNREESRQIQIRSSECGEGPLMCELCPTILKSKASLKRHIETIHAAISLFCAECGKEFDNKRKLSSHRRKHQRDQCPKCGKSVSNGNITHHQKICQGPVGVLHCDQCPYQTKLPSCLKKHKKNEL